MRTTFVALAIFAASTAVAEAGCRLEGAFPGRIAARATVTRTLHLSPSKAQVNVVAELENDKLIMKVRRPSGAAACKTRGPGAQLECEVTVKSKGDHRVIITNPLRRAVTYTMQCWNAP